MAGRRHSSSGPGRRSQQHAAATRERIETAALAAFAAMGFDAASTREIAARAGVNQQLITYHFETKLALWQAAANRIFGHLTRVFAERIRGLEGVGDTDRERLLMREYIRFSADHPELARFMMHEGARPGPRLEWLVDNHVRPLFEALQRRIAEAQAQGLAPACDPIHIAYILIGATTLFSQAAEFKLLTGRDPRDPELVDAHADLVLRLLLRGVSHERGDRYE